MENEKVRRVVLPTKVKPEIKAMVVDAAKEEGISVSNKVENILRKHFGMKVLKTPITKGRYGKN